MFDEISSGWIEHMLVAHEVTLLKESGTLLIVAFALHKTVKEERNSNTDTCLLFVCQLDTSGLQDLASKTIKCHQAEVRFQK